MPNKSFLIDFPDFNPDNIEEVRTAHSIALSNFIGNGIEAGLFKDGRVYSHIKYLSVEFNYWLSLLAPEVPYDYASIKQSVNEENEGDDYRLQKSRNKFTIPDEVLI